MRRILTILFVLIAYNGLSQPFAPRTTGAIIPVDAKLKASQTMYVPVVADTTLNGAPDSLGAVVYSKTQRAFFIRDSILSGGHKWTKLLKDGDVTATTWGNITGTLSNQTDLNTALNLRLLKSDTAAMLLPYFRDVGFGLLKAGQIVRTDTLRSSGLPTRFLVDSLIAANAGASYNFSTGLTETSGTVTANLSTGVVGGQSAIGGTASGNNLTLSSTSNATKGSILFGSSSYDEANNILNLAATHPIMQTVVSGYNQPFTNIVTSNVTGRIYGDSSGAMLMQGFSNNLNTPGLRIQGYIGSATPTISPLIMESFMSDGAGGRIKVGNSNTAFQVFNGAYNTGGATNLITILGNGNTGFGTTTPAQRIDLQGNMQFNGLTFSSPNTDFVISGSGGNGQFRFLPFGNDIYLENNFNGGNIYFRNDGGNLRLAIMTGGNVLIGSGTDNGNGKLQVTGRSTFTDTGTLSARFAYIGNIHSTFQQFSLVDKKYVDSMVATGIGGDTTALYEPLVAYAGAGGDPDTIGIAGLTAMGAAAQMIRINSGATGFEYFSTLGPIAGGTGLTTFTTGDLIYASASNVLSKRAIGSTGDVLTITGGVPVWAAQSTLTTLPMMPHVGADPDNWVAAVSTVTSLPDLAGAGGSKTVTLPSAASNAGKFIHLWNKNADVTNLWSYAAAITLPNGTTTSTFSNGSFSILYSDGSVWVKTN